MCFLCPLSPYFLFKPAMKLLDMGTKAGAVAMGQPQRKRNIPQHPDTGASELPVTPTATMLSKLIV